MLKSSYELGQRCFFILSVFFGLQLKLTSQTHHQEQLKSGEKFERTVALTPRRFHFKKQQIGTIVQLIFYGENSSKAERKAEQLAHNSFALVEELESIFSTYQSDSEISKLSQLELNQEHPISTHLYTVLSLAQRIHTQSKGAFDVSLGTYVKAWRNKKNHRNSDEAKSKNTYVLEEKEQTIRSSGRLNLDLGGIAKGYIADQVAALFVRAGVRSAAIDVGGETVLLAPPPEKKGWRIGIEDPNKKIVGIICLSNTAFSTSGDSHRFYLNRGKRYSHILDPKTKASVRGMQNVIVLSESAMLADAWATAFRVMGTDRSLAIARQVKKIEVLMSNGTSVVKSKDFPDFEPQKLQ